MKRILTVVASCLLITIAAKAQISCAGGSPFNGFFNVTTTPDSVIYPTCTTLSAQLSACGTPFRPGNFPIPNGSTSSYTVDTISSNFYDTTGSTYATMTNNTWNNGNGRVDLNTLGFDFLLYGKRSRYIHISDNGYLRFGNTALPPNVVFSSNTLPSITNPRLAIFGHFRNFDPAVNLSGKYCWKVVGTAPRRALVFSYLNLRVSSAFNSSGYDNTFQIVLYESTNAVEVLTQRAVQINASDNATCGMQDSTGTVAHWSLHYSGATTSRNFTDYSLNTSSLGLHVRFTPSGASNPYAFDWYDVSAAASISTTPSHLLTSVVTATLPRKYAARLTYTNPVTSSVSVITDTVTLASPNITATVDSVTTKCFGTQDGAILINNITAGNPPFTYSISPTPGGSSIVYTPSSTLADTIKGLTGSVAPGTSYTVQITDAGGCIKTYVKRVLSPAAINITAPPGSTLVVPCVQTSFSVVVAGTGGNLSLGSSVISFDTTAGCIRPTPLGAGYTGWALGCTYTILLTDVKGCTGTKTITSNPPPLINITSTAKTDAVCSGTTGSFSLTRTGGYSGPAPPPAGSTWFTYSISPSGGTLGVSPAPGLPGPYSPNHPTTTATWSNLPFGTYTATVTDARGCTRTTVLTIDTFGKPVITFDSIIDVRCFGETNAKIYAKATSTSSSLSFAYTYSYVLSGGTLGSSVTNTTGVFTTGIGVGTYTLTATDNKGCTTSTILAIAQPTVLTIDTVLVTHPLCFGGTNGSVTYTNAGGNSGPIFTILPSAGTTAGSSIFEGLSDATTYTINVTDSKGCSATTTASMIAPPQLIVSGVVRRPLCIGDANGVINLSSVGGKGAITYTADPITAIIAGDSLTGVAAGIPIIVTATDGNNCTDTQSFVFINPPAITATATYDTASCKSVCNAGITLSGAGGTGNAYEYSIDGGAFQTSAIFTNLCATTFTFIVKDSLGCTQPNMLFTAVQPDTLLFVLDSVQNNTCTGAGDGKAWFTVLGGTPPFSFPSLGNLVQLGTRTFRIDNLGCDGFIYTVTDAQGCTAEGAFVVACPVILADVVLPTNATCHDSCNGSISVNVILGGLPFAGGKYVFVIDSIQNREVTCITTPATYPAATSFLINGLSKGDYFARIVDSNGCSQEITFTITQPDSLQISTLSSLNATCFGVCNGSAVVTAIGGSGNFAYNGKPLLLSKTLDTMENLCAGTIYTAVAVDQNNCQVTQTISINEPTQVSVTATASTIKCFGNTSTIRVVGANGTPGAYTYAIGNPAGVFSAVDTFDVSFLGTNSTFTVWASDANNCSISTTINITQPSQIAASASATAVACNNGTAEITIAGTGGTLPYTYSFDDLSYTAIDMQTVSNAGTYTVYIQDANDCKASSTVLITKPTQVTITASATAVSCFSGTSIITVVGANGTGSAYKYALGTAPAIATFALIDTFHVQVTGPSSTYTVWTADVNNCSTSTTIVITQPDSVTINSITLTPTCSTYSIGSAVVSGIGGPTGTTYTYSISPATGTQPTIGQFINLGEGTYTITATSATNSCTGTTAVTINANPLPLISVVVSPSVNVCAGDSVTFTSSSIPTSTTYAWTGGPPSITDGAKFVPATGTTIYTVTALSAAGCTGSTTQSILSAPRPAIGIAVAPNDTVCAGATMTLTASGVATTYAWTGGPPAVTNAASFVPAAGNTTYTVLATDVAGCTSTATQVVFSNPVLNLTASNTAIACNGGNTTVTASVTGGTGPYTYASGAPTPSVYLPTNTFTGPTGTYTLWVEDAIGCTASVTRNVPQPATLNVTATALAILCNGDATEITATRTGGTGAFQYAFVPNPTAFDFSSSSTFATTLSLASETFTVTVQDANGCQSTTTIAITQPSAISVIASATPILCKDSLSTITATASNGTVGAGYQYTLASLPAGFAANNIFAQGVVGTTSTYTIWAQDANGCQTFTTTTITQPATSIVLSIDSTKNPTCLPNTGCIYPSAVGGTGSITYSYGSAFPGTDFVGANYCLFNAGTYTIWARDNNGCSTSASATLFNSSAPVVASTIYPVKCFGTATGCAKLNVSGGTGAGTYSYLWNCSSSTTDSSCGLSAGPCSIEVIDAAQCTTTVSITIPQPALLAANIINADSVICFGGADGSALATVAGGIAPYTYLWDNGQTTSALNSVIAGQYIITITDSNLCTALDTVDIFEPNVLAISASSIVDANCKGDANGSVVLSATGGTPSYGFSPAQTALVAGSYNFVVTDIRGCKDSTTVLIAEPADTLSVNVVTTSSVSCNPGGDGCINVASAGGNAGVFTYTSGATYAGSVSVSNFCLFNAGSYTIWSTDSKGCTAITSATLAIAPLPSISLIADSITCFGGNDGSIVATTINGSGTYTYAWSCSSGITNIASGLSQGTCTVIVTDTAGCADTATILIAQPDAIASSIAAQTNVLCKGDTTGSVSLTVTGGVGPYTYVWSPNVSTTNTASSLAAGSYQVTVTDANLCTYQTTVVITEPTSTFVLTASGITNVSCFAGNDGSVTITPSGGTVGSGYLVATTPAQSALLAGTYTYTAVDGNSCSASTDITITQPASAVVVTVDSTRPPTCNPGFDGCIYVSSNGGTSGYTYTQGAAYAGSVPLVNCSFSSGTYTIWSTDANGCTSSTTATLITPGAPTVTLTVDSVSCFGGNNGQITANVSGGILPYIYSWTCDTSTTAIAANLVAGSCTLTVTDSAGCASTVSVSVPEPAAITSSISAQTNVLCKGDSTGSVSLNVTGGVSPYSYVWSPNVSTSNTASSLAAGSYQVTVTDANACTYQTTIVITEPTNAFILTASSINTVSCFGGTNGSVTITPSGGTLAYTITSAAATAGLSAGAYTYTAVDGNGCTASTVVNISEPLAAVAIIVDSISSPTCTPGFDGCINVSTTGGNGTYSYSYGPAFAGSTPIVANNFCIFDVNTYTLWASDGNGCFSSTIATLNNATGPALIMTVDSVKCFGSCTGSASVAVTGGTAPFTYAWTCPNTNSTTNFADSLCAGPCSVVVTDALGCASSEAFTVPTPAVFTFDTSSITGYSMIQPTSAFAANGKLSILGASGGTPPYQYQITSVGVNGTNTLIAGLQSSNILLNIAATDTLQVVAIDANGCVAADTMYVPVTAPSALFATAQVFDEYCVGLQNGEIIINAFGSVGPYTYSVSPFLTAPSLTGILNQVASYYPVAPGAYIITVTAANGDTVMVPAFVAQADTLNVTVTPVNPTCGTQGSISVSGLGGAGGLTTILRNGSFTLAGPDSLPASYTGLPADSYTVITTDLNGCADTQAVMLTNPSSLTFANFSTTQAYCTPSNNACVNFGITGAAGQLSANINSGAFTNFTSPYNVCTFAAGTYTIEVKDASNNCSQSTVFIINSAPAPTLTIDSSKNVNCFGENNGAIYYTIAGANALSVTINGIATGTASSTGLIAGSYTIIVTDNITNCTSSVIIPITQPAILGITATGTNPTIAGVSNGSITASASGGTIGSGYQYSINGGSYQSSGTFNNLNDTCYIISVLDANGCTITTSVCLVDPGAIACQATIANGVSCFGATNAMVSITANGGIGALTVSGPSVVYTPDTLAGPFGPGTFTFIVNDVPGAACTTSVTITQPTALVASIASSVNPGCNPNTNGSATASATGGTAPYSYAWPSAGAVNAGLGIGTYVVTVTDDSGCTATASVVLTTAPSPTINVTSLTAATCANPCSATVTATTTGGTAPVTISILPTVALNALCAGTTYTLTATDSKGCTSQTTVLPTITANPTASVSSTTSALCANDSSGTVLFTTNASPFTASISGTAVTSVTAQAGPSFTGLKAGNFTIVITNTSTGCSTSVTGSIAPTLALGISGTTVNTSSAVATVCDGQINVTVVNGAAVYTVTAASANYTTTSVIAAAGTTNITTNACAGNYTLTVQDANGCTSTNTVVVLAPGQLVCNVSNIVNVSCFSGNNGSAQITGQGGVALAGGNYSWQINNGGTISSGAINPATASTLSNGAYIVTVTDANNVTSTCAINITQPTAAVTSNAVVTTQATCLTGATVSVTAAGGTLAYSLVWNGAASVYGNPITNVAPGTYTYSVTDNNSCSTTGSITVDTVALPIISAVVTTEDKCGNTVAFNTGTISITAASLNGGLLYGIGTSAANANNASNVLTGYQNGNYTVIVKDAFGCTATMATNVPIAPNPIITNIATTDATCVPGGDGTITITATSGVAINTYATTTGTGSVSANVISALAANNYTVVVTDANNCTATSATAVNTANSPTVSLVGSTVTQCVPNAVGSFTLTTGVISGGSVSMLPNIGSIVNNAGTITASTLQQGTYTVTVTNADGCSVTTSVVVNKTPNPVITSTNVTHLLCNSDSSGSFSVVANVSTFTATITSTGWGSLANNTGVFTILPAANFTITIVDSNGCQDTAFVTVTEPAVLTASTPVVNKITCNGNTNGTYSTSAIGGTTPYLYTIKNNIADIDSNTTGSFTGLAAGTYTVVIRDANGCLTSNSGIVQNVPAIVFGAAAITNPACFGDANGKVCITATGGNVGGLTYSPGVYLAGCYTGLAAGTYTFTATDALNCNGTTSVTLVNPPSVVLTVDSIKHVKCFGQTNGAIYINGSGGQGAPFQYSLNGAAFGTSSAFSSLAFAVYTVAVRDANACSTNTTISITQPNVLAFGNFAFTHITCNGTNNGTITPGVTGGTLAYNTTLQTTGSATLPLGSATSWANVPPGNYTIASTDANGCTINTTLTLTEPAPLVAVVDSIDHIACFGGNDGCIRVVPPTGGTPPYQYSYADANGGPIPMPTSLICGLPAGTYTLSIKDSNGCNAATPPITITQPAQFAVSNTSIVHVRCFGDLSGEIAVQVTGGTKFPVGGSTRYSFVVTGPTAGPVTYGDSSALYTNLGAGIYNVVVTDANGCATSTQFTITQNNLIVFDSAVSFTQPRCFNEANGLATIYSSGGVPPLAYAMLPWQVNPSTNNVVDSIASGTYTIVVQDAVGCTVTSVFVMPQPDPLLFSNVTVTNANCENSNDGVLNVDAIGGNGAYLYSVVPGVRVSTVGVFGGVPPGTYTINVIDRFGCNNDTIITLGVNPNPIQITVQTTTPIACKSFGNGGALTAFVNGGTTPYSYIWNTTTPIQTTATASSLVAGTYNVLVMDATGCTGSALAELRGDDTCCDVSVPNAFTPNGDGLNDVFRLISGADITLLNFAILDRWGNRTFQTNTPTTSWNGRINNIDAEGGSYYWVITYVCNSTQETITLSGDVMLIR
jgi:gliding motility-associated-like protein